MDGGRFSKTLLLEICVLATFGWAHSRDTTRAATTISVADATRETTTSIPDTTEATTTLPITDETCHVTWSVEEAAAGLNVTWSGDVDEDSWVIVNASKICGTDPLCAEETVRETAPFSRGWTLLAVDPTDKYTIDVDFRCTLNESSTTTTWIPKVPSAPRNLSCPTKTNTSVSLTWEEPETYRSPILRYIVELNKTRLVETDGTSYTVSDLAPYVSHTFRVQAETKEGKGKWSKELTVLTDIGVPHAPTFLKTTSVSNTTVGLKWNKPANSTGPVLGYRIHSRNASGGEGVERDTHTKIASYTVDGLTPFTEYAFKVLALTAAGPGQWSESLQVRTDAGVPHAPTSLESTFVSNTTVGLRWEEPGISTGPILGYRIRWNDSSNGVENERDTGTNVTSYTMEGLTPYTTYTFKVLALTDAGPGQGSEILEVRTDVGVPHAPTSLESTFVSNTTVGLKWKEPGISTGPILGYRIRWNDSSGGGSERETGTNITSYTMDRLTPYTKYTFEVLASTTAGPGQWSESLEVGTGIGVPHAPEAITTTYVRNSTVGLKWEEPGISTGPILGFRIRWKDSSNGAVNEQDTGTVTAYALEGLTPYTMYTFEVLAFTEAGPGQWSEILEVRTDVGVPHAPTSLRATAVGNTSVHLDWTEPNVSTGPILTYRIHWKNSSAAGEVEATSGATSNLTPYVEYTFKVLAVTRAGPGPWSEELVVKTKVGVPHAPEAITTTYVRNTTVGLKWEEPGISTGPILGYRIRWNDSSGEEGERETGTNVTSYTMDRLTPYTKYTFEVLASTAAGPGRWSDSLEVRTGVGVPHAPTSARATHAGNTTVGLEWKEPEISTGPILGYRIHWKNSSGEGERDTGTKVTRYRMESLTPYVQYTFKVLALTEAGPGQWSENLEVRTDIGVPTVPRNLRVERATDVSLQISWTRPEFPRAPELDYVVAWNTADVGDPEEVKIPGDIAKETVRHAVTDLLPYTNYSVSVSAVTKAGRGRGTHPLRVETAIGVPLPAVIWNATVLRRRAVEVLWSTKGPFPGPVDFSLQAWRHPSPCSGKLSAVVDKEVKGSKNSGEWKGGHRTRVEGLSPFGNYSFLVLLKTLATDGVESKKSEIVQIPPEASGEPLNVVAECEWSSTQARVRWDPPKSPNGWISSYKIQYESLQDRKSVRVYVSDVCNRQSHVISGMRPERPYRITVTATVEGVREDGKPANPKRACILPAGIPSLGNTSRLLATADAPHRLTLEWTKDTFSEYMGTIIRYAILVGRRGSLGESTSGRSAYSIPPWSNFSSGTSDFYQATPPDWNPFGAESDPLDCRISSIEEENNRTLLRCTVGGQRQCAENETYCNGPLEPDTRYEMKIRGFTRGGYNETRLIYARTAPLPKKDLTGLAVAVAVLLSLAGALAGGCYVMKKKGLLEPLADVIRRTFMPTKEASTSGDSGLEMHRSKASRCVKAKHFAEHVRLMMSDSHLQFSQEFEALKNASPQLPCTVAETEENRSKNRWMNIFPFDHSRVKLLPLCDEPGSDFINANYIPGFSSPREYIASQGPLPHTVDDFWRMVWEQSVTTIVMLTQCVERGKKKCEQYWPDPGEAQYYGDLVVGTVSESILSSYVIRVLHLQLGSYERQVKQMHFTRWPDFGCPESPEDLINFVNAVRDHLPRSQPGPVVVHCSAGVGRTGTFIAVDRLSRQLRSATHPGEDTVDIYGAVVELRNHRTNMVQTEDQYIYIHSCVGQLIEDRDRHQRSAENIYSNVGVESDAVV